MVQSSAFAVAVFAALALASPIQDSSSSSASASCNSSKAFNLRANLVRGGPASYDNTFIEPQHDGAGANALVASHNEPSASGAYTLRDGYIIGAPYDPSFIQAIGLPAVSRVGAPAVDYLTTFNISSLDAATATATGGFGILPGSNEILPPSNTGFMSFVVCNVSFIPPGAGPQLQLLWSREPAEATPTSTCADVALYAVYE